MIDWYPDKLHITLAADGSTPGNIDLPPPQTAGRARQDAAALQQAFRHFARSVRVGEEKGLSLFADTRFESVLAADYSGRQEALLTLRLDTSPFFSEQIRQFEVNPYTISKLAEALNHAAAEVEKLRKGKGDVSQMTRKQQLDLVDEVEGIAMQTLRNDLRTIISASPAR